MQNNDLSSRAVPRILVVFEGALGIIPDDKISAFNKARRKSRITEAISYYELNELMLRKLNDIRWRRPDMNVVIVTWLGEKEAEAIAERLDEEGISVLEVIFSSPPKLSRALAYNPDIMAVYDPDPEHVFTYGGKGVILTDPNQIGRF